MSTLAAIELGVTAAGAIGGTAYGIKARQTQEAIQANELRSQINQTRLATTEQMNKRTGALISTLGSAAATEAARHVSLASPSFQTIQNKSYDDYVQDQTDSKLNLMFRENTLKQQLAQNKLASEVDVGTSIARLGEYFGNNIDMFRIGGTGSSASEQAAEAEASGNSYIPPVGGDL